MFPSVDDVNYGGQGKVPEAAVDRMVADLEKQYVNLDLYTLILYIYMILTNEFHVPVLELRIEMKFYI